MPKFMKSRWAEQNPEAANRARRSQRARYYAATAFSGRGGERWSDWEDDLILSGTVSDRDAAALLDRSVKSVQSRRWRLKTQGGRS